MIKIAHEAPIDILKKVQPLTDYSYALVHLFETHPEYYEFFVNERKQGRTVLLDNSIFELGTAFDTKEYVKWIEKLQPNFYILPDVLENGEQTILNFQEFVTEYNDLPGMKIGTVQGKTFDELYNCYTFMSEHADMIAISFDLSYYSITGRGYNKLQRQCSGRQKLIRDLHSCGVWNSRKPHHLLGCSLAKEFSYYTECRIEGIYSCDTSNPVMAGLHGIRYNGPFGIETKPSQKLVELIDKRVTEDEWSVIEYNIHSFRQGVHGGAK